MVAAKKLLGFLVAALLDEQPAERSNMKRGCRMVFAGRLQPIEQRAAGVSLGLRNPAQPRFDPRGRQQNPIGLLFKLISRYRNYRRSRTTRMPWRLRASAR